MWRALLSRVGAGPRARDHEERDRALDRLWLVRDRLRQEAAVATEAEHHAEITEMRSAHQAELARVQEQARKRERELANGRLAMIGAMGFSAHYMIEGSVPAVIGNY
mgnify:CR=1 FL=1